MSKPHRFTRLVFAHDSIFEVDSPETGAEDEDEDSGGEEDVKEIVERRATSFRMVDRIGVIHKGSLAALDTTESLIRKISGDQVELYLKNRLTILPSEITEVPVLIEADGKKIRFEEKGEAVNRVLKGLHKHGIEVDRIDVRRPTLEDAFMQLTKKNTNP